jgi:membrane-associated protease RseP (regulator of RpoE activity)
MRILRTSLLALALALPGSAVHAAHAQRAPGWIGIGFEVKSGPQTAGDPAAAVVTEVREGSPASAAGIEVGDRLLTINGVSTVGDFERLAERLALRVGDRVQIRLDRDGRRIDLSLRAAERPGDFSVWTMQDPLPTDSMTESAFRAMDSLRIHILATAGGAFDAPPPPPDAPRARFNGAPPAGPDPVDAPFEFFVFRGEQHDSLRLEMEELNQEIEALREQEIRLTQRRGARSVSRSEMREVESQLEDLRADIEDVVLQSAELRAAMAQAARATAGLEYFLPQPPDAPGAVAPERAATFRPLTPYLLGSNRVAGAEVVDLRPGLAEYFDVETGVLVVDVAAGTPAAIAGIQPGDVIVQLDRIQVRSVDELRTGLSRAGDTLPITLVRQGNRLEVLLRRR